MSIKLLSKDTAEKIAAGEVIENPASVIKELVENALDAGAERIEVSILNGGRDLISVADDGEGIRADEVSLAFQRFATSKLAAINDLDQLTSLGFRGEALPSIAAVSKLEMITRPQDAVGATRIVLEGGEEKELGETGAPFGTKVTVKDLFFNTPGRKKFLRAAAVETSRVSSLITAMALAHPDRSFSLQSNERNLLKTTGDGTLLHVIGAIYGPDSAAAMIQLRGGKGEEGIVVEGCVSAPHYNRSSRKWVTVIVNGRIVNNYQISAALIRAYGDQLPVKRYPLAVLNLKVSPEMIDVNVHPAKTEIRFLDAEAAKKAVYRSVKLSLQNFSITPQWPEHKFKSAFSNPADSYRQSSFDLSTSSLYREEDAEGEFMARESSLQPLEDQEQQERTNFAYAAALKDDSVTATDIKQETAYYNLIGQYLKSYIIVQRGEDLLLIDQHAAHERLIYNQLKGNLTSALKAGASQLTIPYALDIPVLWREHLPGVLPYLKSCGIDLEPIDLDSYVIRAVPLILNEPLKDYEIIDLLERLINEEEGDKASQHDALLKTIACHRSIKAKQPLTREEMNMLLEEWFDTEAAGYCPHGRPTMISFDRQQLEKSFLRRSSS
jgi:DNA mismatch repair protein MutL